MGAEAGGRDRGVAPGTASLWSSLANRLSARPRQLSRRPGVRSVVIESPSEGQAVILVDASRGPVLRLGSRDHWVWERLDGKRSLDQIACDYFEEYGTIAVDRIHGLVSELRAAGLVSDVPTEADVYVALERRLVEQRTSLRRDAGLAAGASAAGGGPFARILRWDFAMRVAILGPLLGSSVGRLILLLVGVAGVVAWLVAPGALSGVDPTRPAGSYLLGLVLVVAFNLKLSAGYHAARSGALAALLRSRGLSVGDDSARASQRVQVEFWGPLPVVSVAGSTPALLPREDRFGIEVAGVSTDLAVGGVALLLGRISAWPQVISTIWALVAVVALARALLSLCPLLDGAGARLLEGLFDVRDIRRRVRVWLSGASDRAREAALPGSAAPPVLPAEERAYVGYGLATIAWFLLLLQLALPAAVGLLGTTTAMAVSGDLTLVERVAAVLFVVVESLGVVGGVAGCAAVLAVLVVRAVSLPAIWQRPRRAVRFLGLAAVSVVAVPTLISYLVTDSAQAIPRVHVAAAALGLVGAIFALAIAVAAERSVKRLRGGPAARAPLALLPCAMALAVALACEMVAHTHGLRGPVSWGGNAEVPVTHVGIAARLLAALLAAAAGLAVAVRAGKRVIAAVTGVTVAAVVLALSRARPESSSGFSVPAVHDLVSTLTLAAAAMAAAWFGLAWLMGGRRAALAPARGLASLGSLMLLGFVCVRAAGWQVDAWSFGDSSGRAAALAAVMATGLGVAAVIALVGSLAATRAASLRAQVAIPAQGRVPSVSPDADAQARLQAAARFLMTALVERVRHYLGKAAAAGLVGRDLAASSQAGGAIVVTPGFEIDDSGVADAAADVAALGDRYASALREVIARCEPLMGTPLVRATLQGALSRLSWSQRSALAQHACSGFDALPTVQTDLAADVAFDPGSRVALLRESVLFSGLDDGALAEIATRLWLEHRPVGSVIIYRGDRDDRLLLLARGTARVLAPDAGGVDSCRGYLEQGAVFGESALLRNLPRTATVECASDCWVLSLSRDAFSELCRADRSALEGVVQGVEDFSLFRAAPVFSELDRPRLSALFARARAARYEAGNVIMREGDDGDRCYVVRQGTLEVRQGGQVVTELGRGDVAGEVALILDCPRTASVEAKTDVELLAVDGAAFRDVVRAAAASGGGSFRSGGVAGSGGVVTRLERGARDELLAL